MSESADALAQTYQTLAEIMVICRDRNDLRRIVSARFEEIIAAFDKTPEELTAASTKPRAQREIEEHIAMIKKTTGRVIKPTSVAYRDIALLLAKHNDLAFDPKTTKKKDDIIAWFDANWDKIHADLFVLLDQLPTNHQFR